MTRFDRNTIVEQRCRAGVACEEVSARLVAIDKARSLDELDHHPALDQLRQWAGWIAEAHGYGTGESS